MHSHPYLPLYSKVNSLISNGNTWGVANVYGNSDRDEAETILSIPLLGDRNDYRIWHLKTNGRYIVNSGYWVSLKYRNLMVIQSCKQTLHIQVWKRISKVKITPKVSHLLWRVANDCILTRQNLLRRQIVDDRTCPGCLNALESTFHAFHDYYFYTRFQEKLGFPRSVWCSSIVVITDWLREVWDSIPPLLFPLFATRIWWLWFDKNQLVFEAQGMEFDVLI